jgi:hypothetical protein
LAACLFTLAKTKGEGDFLLPLDFKLFDFDLARLAVAVVIPATGVQPIEFAPFMLGLAAAVTMALDCAIQFALFMGDLAIATVVPICGLRHTSTAEQEKSTQRDCE